MKIWKNSILIISIAVVLLATATVSADSDTTGDVLHWRGTDWTNWDWNVGDRQNIDIVDISYTAGDRLTITMTVNGVINSEKSLYHVWYNTSNAWYYLRYFPDEDIEPQAMALPLDFENFTIDEMLNWTNPEAEASIDGSTISATFDWVTEDHTMTGFWAWSQEWENIGDQFTEFWIDYAPNDFSPYGDFEDYEEAEDDEEEEEEDTSGDGTEGDDQTPSDSTPDFEIFAIIAAIGISLLILRRRK